MSSSDRPSPPPHRVAFVRQFGRADGGAERFLDQATRILAARGDVEPIVVARKWSPAPGVSVVRVDPPYRSRLERDSGFAKAVPSKLEELRPTLVQSHERIPGLPVYRAGDGVHASWLAARARVLGPIARLAQWLDPWHRYTLQAERAMFRHPALRAVICNARFVLEDVHTRFDVPRSALRHVPNGVDLERFHPDLGDAGGVLRRRYGIPSEVPLLLFVGSGFARKGLATVLRAMAALDARPHLLVVGRDRRLARYRRRARLLGLRSRVHFVGALDDPRPAFGAADLLVLPTLYDPFPNVVLEALAAGLPCLAARSSGAADIIREGENGSLLDPLDVPSWARALESWLEDASLRQAAGHAARETAEAYPLERVASLLEELYDQLLGAAREV